MPSKRGEAKNSGWRDGTHRYASRSDHRPLTCQLCWMGRLRREEEKEKKRGEGPCLYDKRKDLTKRKVLLPGWWVREG